MRETPYLLPRDQALALLADAQTVQIAGVGADGAPMIRSLHAIVRGETLYLHTGRTGEKQALAGQRIAISAEHTIARIPSWFRDPERACPATTWYRSAQALGRLLPVEDLGEKAEILRAFMAKYQPEGGHVRIDADDPLYRKPLQALAVWRAPLERVVGRANLGQKLSLAKRAQVIGGLWRRGDPGDLEAIVACRAARPDTPWPAPLAPPAGLELALDPTPHMASLVDLLAATYWNQDVTREQIAAAQRGADAWLGWTDAETGRLLAGARAISDGSKFAWIYDVVVAPDRRGQGLGDALMRLLLDHPAVRGARRVLLGTRDAQGFYARMGFVERERAGIVAMELAREELTRG